MKKIEYKLVEYSPKEDFVYFWNMLGNDGWEFCMLLPETAPGKTFFLVKRFKTEQKYITG